MYKKPDPSDTISFLEVNDLTLLELWISGKSHVAGTLVKTSSGP